MTRLAVTRFSSLMEQKLKENDHKPSWSADSFERLFPQLIDEINELYRAHVAGETSLNIAKECADVANFAMMIADNEYFKVGRG